MAPVFYMYDYNTMLLSTGYFILALGLRVGPTYAGLYVGYVAYVAYDTRYDRDVILTCAQKPT